MRIAPLVVIIVLMIGVATTLGTTLLWVVAGLSLLALGVLIFVMARQNLFVGPRVLVDDARERFERAGREPEEVIVAEVRREGEDDR